MGVRVLAFGLGGCRFRIYRLSYSNLGSEALRFGCRVRVQDSSY